MSRKIKTDLVNNANGDVITSFCFDPMLSVGDVLKLEALVMSPAEISDFNHLVKGHGEVTRLVEGKQANVAAIDKTLSISFDVDCTYLQIDIYVNLENGET